MKVQSKVLPQEMFLLWQRKQSSNNNYKARQEIKDGVESPPGGRGKCPGRCDR